MEYLTLEEQKEAESEVKSAAKRFYSKKKFSFIEDASNKANKLSYCKSCNIVRPPRAFHCAKCDFCVEIHDHHCPWMGTCIGYRNVRYFILFLFMTATHALYAFGIVFYVCFIQKDVSFFRPDIDRGLRFLSLFMLFTGLASMALYQFAYYQFCNLALTNRTTNEHLRGRWNGAKENRDRVMQVKTSRCSKLREFLFGEIPASKLEILS